MFKTTRFPEIFLGVVQDLKKCGESKSGEVPPVLVSSSEIARIGIIANCVRHNLWTRKELIARTLPNISMQSFAYKNVYLPERVDPVLPPGNAHETEFENH